MMLEELQRRNLSQLTAECYLRAVEEFALFYKRPPDQLGPEQIRQYQAHLFVDRKLDANTVCQHLSALRFFFIKTLKRKWTVEETPYPKRPIRLPDVLSREEVELLIDSTDSPMHRMWLLTLYATGVRREELVQLKVSDIDSARMLIHIHEERESGSRCDAQPEAARRASRLLALNEPQAQDLSVSRRRPRSCHRCADERQERLPRSQTRCQAGRAPKTRPPAYHSTLLRDAPARIRHGLAHDTT